MRAEELMLWTVVLEKTLESPLDCKEIKNVNPKGNHHWVFIGRTDAEISNTLATWCKYPTHWKRPWLWERLKAKGEGGSRGWDGWIVSLIQWTWTWANSRRQWGTGRPGMLQSLGSQSWTWLSDWKTTNMFICVCFYCSLTKLCPTLKAQGSSVHRLLQARILEWISILFPRTCVCVCVCVFIYLYKINWSLP